MICIQKKHILWGLVLLLVFAGGVLFSNLFTKASQKKIPTKSRASNDFATNNSVAFPPIVLEEMHAPDSLVFTDTLNGGFYENRVLTMRHFQEEGDLPKALSDSCFTSSPAVTPVYYFLADRDLASSYSNINQRASLEDALLKYKNPELNTDSGSAFRDVRMLETLKSRVQYYERNVLDLENSNVLGDIYSTQELLNRSLNYKFIKPVYSIYEFDKLLKNGDERCASGVYLFTQTIDKKGLFAVSATENYILDKLLEEFGVAEWQTAAGIPIGKGDFQTDSSRFVKKTLPYTNNDEVFGKKIVAQRDIQDVQLEQIKPENSTGWLRYTTSNSKIDRIPFPGNGDMFPTQLKLFKYISVF